MKKRWIIFMAILSVICILGVFMPQETADIWVADETLNFADVAWMITATIFVLMMTPGLSFFYGGMVRPKNVISTMLQSFVAMGVISIMWVTFLFSLSFGDSIGGLVGNPMTFFMFQNVGAKTHILAPTIPLALYALFQMKFAIITPSLITGAFAERVHFSGYIVFMMLFAIFIYAPLAHWTWHPDGFLKQMGVIDFAGGIVIHASSGVAALAGAIFFGKRHNRENHNPANIVLVLLGAAMLWLGWFGFNAGSSLAADSIAIKAFLNTNTASATGMMTWLFFDAIRGRKPSGMGVAIGAVIGLVAITPSAGFVTVGQSMMIAFITSIVCNIAVHWHKQHSIDDTLDVFRTHGIGGIIGTILTGVFVLESGASYFTMAHLHSIWVHILAIVIVCSYAFIVSWCCYWLTNKMIRLRVSPENEAIGLDISQHDEEYFIGKN